MPPAMENTLGGKCSRESSLVLYEVARNKQDNKCKPQQKIYSTKEENTYNLGQAEMFGHPERLSKNYASKRLTIHQLTTSSLNLVPSVKI